MVLLTELGFKVNKNVLFDNKSNILGFINPGVLISFENEKLIFVGPLKTAYSKKNPTEIIKAMWKSHVLIKCDKKSIAYTLAKLNDPLYSRTTAYLLNFITHLSEVKIFFSSISKVKIGILGCGGIGSNLTILLGGIGFKKLILIDHDKIEKSNLNRQTVFSINDIGLKKIDVLAREIKKRFPTCIISKVNKLIKPNDLSELFKNIDFVVISADNPPNLFSFAQEYGFRYKKPIMAAGYSMGVGKIFMVKETKIRFDKLQWQSPPIDISSSAGPLNYEVAALASNLMIKYFLGKIKNKVTRYEWNSLDFPRKKIHWN